MAVAFDPRPGGSVNEVVASLWWLFSDILRQNIGRLPAGG